MTFAELGPSQIRGFEYLVLYFITLLNLKVWCNCRAWEWAEVEAPEISKKSILFACWD